MKNYEKTEAIRKFHCEHSEKFTTTLKLAKKHGYRRMIANMIDDTIIGICPKCGMVFPT